jgi:hypothetical protein
MRLFFSATQWLILLTAEAVNFFDEGMYARFCLHAHHSKTDRITARKTPKETCISSDARAVYIVIECACIFCLCVFMCVRKPELLDDPVAPTFTYCYI